MGRRQIVFLGSAVIVILIMIAAGITYRQLTFSSDYAYTYPSTSTITCNTPPSSNFRIILDCTPLDGPDGEELTFFEERTISGAEFTLHVTETVRDAEFACLSDPETNIVFWLPADCGVPFE